MAGYPNDPEELWDEYQWERFLREQDRNTDKYLALMDKYSDHPDRDRIIAREMGWKHLEEELAELEQLEFEEAAEAELEDILYEGEDDEEDDFEEFTQSEIYRATVELHQWVSKIFESHPDLENHPEGVRLACSAALCGAKLAAAMCGCDDSEPGMVVAYLKRALKAANDALEAGVCLSRQKLIKPRQLTALNRRLFPIRDSIIDLMREYREEWRRRREEGY